MHNIIECVKKSNVFQAKGEEIDLGGSAVTGVIAIVPGIDRLFVMSYYAKGDNCVVGTAHNVLLIEDEKILVTILHELNMFGVISSLEEAHAKGMYFLCLQVEQCYYEEEHLQKVIDHINETICVALYKLRDIYGEKIGDSDSAFDAH